MTSPKEVTTWTTQIDDSGEFVRKPTTFRNKIEPNGEHPPEADRYHLYVSYACPWAHRTLLARALKGLTETISVDVVDSFLGSEGWTLRGTEPGATGDRVNGFSTLREAYRKTDSNYAGSITVPVLWDKKASRIVNNESSEIIRFFNSEFQSFARHAEVDLYPEPLRDRIDEINGWVYHQINNGVYRAGFARSQDAYDRAVEEVFRALDRVESILSSHRFLLGSAVTEADVRLFPTLLRFDLVYHTHFKCNVRRIVDYPNLWAYLRDLYAQPGVMETIRLDHVKWHYYRSHKSINPFGVVPAGPAIDFTAPQDRARRFV